MTARPTKRRKVAIMGFGVTGRAVARALLAWGDDPLVFDDSPPPDAAAVAAAVGVSVEPTPTDDLAGRLAGFDLLVPSPGVPFGHPVYAAAAELGIPVQAEVELAAARARAQGGPRLVAVTGTNGKTTVTTLVTAMLQASGLTAVAAGNIGTPLIEAVSSGADVLVAEVSSFQLQYTDTFRPEVGCWLNLAPDHLDWHPNFAHYAAAKARIWARQQPGDTAVFNADDPFVAASAELPAGVARLSFSIREPACFGVADDRLVGPGGEPLIERRALPRAFPHDLSNALAAAATARSCGATLAGCRAALATTPVPPHRVEFVGAGDGVQWFDDSKATTPASVLAAVAAFESVVLIAGGRNKGLDLGPLAATVPPVRAVVAIGEAAAEVEAAFGALVPVARASDMEAAVAVAGDLARSGDTVLLSPGCASFDWYQSYAARGDHFASIVTRRLAREEHRC